jgi:hypothetical protein
VDTNEEQTLTLDGRYRFAETNKAQYVPGKPYQEEYTGNSPCHGCAMVGVNELAPPCSPGARKDGKSGIWKKV